MDALASFPARAAERSSGDSKPPPVLSSGGKVFAGSASANAAELSAPRPDQQPLASLDLVAGDSVQLADLVRRRLVERRDRRQRVAGAHDVILRLFLLLLENLA